MIDLCLTGTTRGSRRRTSLTNDFSKISIESMSHFENCLTDILIEMPSKHIAT